VTEAALTSHLKRLLKKSSKRSWWEPPASAGGSWTLVQRKIRSISKSALALVLPIADAKARDHSNLSRSAEALLTPHKCGGSHQEVRSQAYTLTFPVAGEGTPLQNLEFTRQASHSPDQGVGEGMEFTSNSHPLPPRKRKSCWDSSTICPTEPVLPA
jgi:hypothetical protein